VVSSGHGGIWGVEKVAHPNQHPHGKSRRNSRIRGRRSIHRSMTWWRTPAEGFGRRAQGTKGELRGIGRGAQLKVTRVGSSRTANGKTAASGTKVTDPVGSGTPFGVPPAKFLQSAA